MEILNDLRNNDFLYITNDLLPNHNNSKLLSQLH